MLADLAPARRRLVGIVLAALVVVIAMVTVVVGIRLSNDSAPVRPADQSHAGPVLLVPGYGGSTSGLERLADRIRAAGRPAEVVGLPDGGTGDLRAQARVLATAVTAARRRTGATSVDVVGYSAGGVVTRLWVRDFGGAAQARRIITLGAPHHGTDLAALAGSLTGSCPAACTQLAPDSDLLSGLNQGDETPAGPQFVSIWTGQDEVVVPPDSARLDGATDVVVQDVCADARVGHSQLPTDPLVTGMVLAELTGPATVDLGQADCQRLSS